MEADRRGNANGSASKGELEKIRGRAQMEAVPGVPDPIHTAGARSDALDAAIGSVKHKGVQTLDPALKKLPTAVRKLALEIDGLWGNADGNVSLEELDRVAKYYLAALPYFTPEAGALLELAEFLGYDKGPAQAKSVVELRGALAHVDKREVEDGKQFRAMFDEAIESCDVAGAPELIREAAEHNPRWHSLGILEHTAVAVDAAREVGQALGVDWRHLGATMLLHDVGKLLQRGFVDDDGESGRYHFWEHEGIGAGWLQAHGVDPGMMFHVRYHSVLRENTEQEMISLCGTKERLTEALAVYIADQVAKGIEPAQLQSFDGEREKITHLAEHCGVDPQVLFDLRRALVEKHFGVDPG
jgi:hypothetical protein